MSMNVLVIGQGGREHALIKALSLSRFVDQVHSIPGSDGISQEALIQDLRDPEAILKYIQKNGIHLVVFGPENPLAMGWADFFRESGVDVLGPSRTGAQLEASKIFAKEFMKRAGVPTSEFQVVGSVEEVLKAKDSFRLPYVLKADGLAAGKGVFICHNEEELKEAANKIFVQKVFGETKALMEQFQSGWEISYLVLTNGSAYTSLPLTQDHKSLFEGGRGPNTGGMGAVGPLSIDDKLERDINEWILQPTVKELSRSQIDYRGVLYVGVMVTPEGPQVLEYNVRFGDPEAQVVLPLLEGDWGLVFQSMARGKVIPLQWKPIYSACVVLAAENYPDTPKKGVVIEGDIMAQTPSSYFLHAGTKKVKDHWVTNGGRVLNAVAIGSSLEEAIENAYEQARFVQWPGLQMRLDIGQKGLGL